MADELSRRLGQNMRHLRDVQGLTQEQMAKLSGLPRATWANLESGTANPTLAVLTKVATALRVSLEELIAAPKAACQHYERDSLPTQQRGAVTVRKLLPDPIPGMDLERLEIPPNSQMTGSPHTPGTREYLTCESGTITLFAAGETYVLAPGDVVVFHGDQRHSYRNDGSEMAIGYSVVMFLPML
jgi:transcriptional regulator with XRE-family HTH domain